jgi:hypothetical protein
VPQPETDIRWVTDASDRVGQAERPALAFAPEAHLPRERRLIVDSSGVTLETSLGVRHVLAWGDCKAVMTWGDRTEILLQSDVSVVIRRRDWHRGAEALRAIKDRAPASVLVPMLDDPEPEPNLYVLRGLAKSSSVVLIVLLLSLAIVSVMGLAIGMQEDRVPALVIGLIFGVAAVGTTRSLATRLRVPRRWRDAAAVRGRMSVEVDSRVARASDKALEVAEPVLYGLAGVTIGILAATRRPSLLPPLLILGVALAVRRERKRRRR